MKKQILTLFIFISVLFGFSQSMPPAPFDDGVQTDFLDIYSNTQTQINGWIIPSGITRLAWNVTEQELQWYNGSEWVCISCSSSSPNLDEVLTTGNTSTQTINTQGISESGTIAGSDYFIGLGDTSGSNTGNYFKIDDSVGEIELGVDFGGGIFRVKSELYSHTSLGLTNGIGTTRFVWQGFNGSSDIAVPGQGGYLSVFVGNYNASTNTPTLSNTDNYKNGAHYLVTVAGTQDFGAGDITFGVGDIIANNGTIWYKKVNNNQSGSTQTLEDVTGEGNTTPDNIVINGSFSSYFQVSDTGNFRYGYLYPNGLLFSRDANNLSVNTPTLTGNRAFDLRDGDVDLTGGSDGDVLTVQSDGSVEFEAPSGGSTTSTIVENASVSGTYNIDWDNDAYYLTLTGATTLTESNLPISGETKEIKLFITGDYSLSLPANWDFDLSGEYVGDYLNKFSVNYLKANEYVTKIDNGWSRNLVADSNFDNTADYWTAESGWTFGTNDASYDAVTTLRDVYTSLLQNIVIGDTVEIKFTITGLTGGDTAYFRLNGGPAAFTGYTNYANGTHIETVSWSDQAVSSLRFEALNTGTGGAFTLSNVSLRKKL